MSSDKVRRYRTWLLAAFPLMAVVAVALAFAMSPRGAAPVEAATAGQDVSFKCGANTTPAGQKADKCTIIVGQQGTIEVLVNALPAGMDGYAGVDVRITWPAGLNLTAFTESCNGAGDADQGIVGAPSPPVAGPGDETQACVDQVSPVTEIQASATDPVMLFGFTCKAKTTTPLVINMPSGVGSTQVNNDQGDGTTPKSVSGNADTVQINCQNPPPTPTPTQTPTPPAVPPKNLNSTISADPLDNIWLTSPAADGSCANNAETVDNPLFADSIESINAINMISTLGQQIATLDPKTGEVQELGSYEFEVRFDNKLLCFVRFRGAPDLQINLGQLTIFPLDPNNEWSCLVSQVKGAVRVGCVHKGKEYANPPSSWGQTLCNLILLGGGECPEGLVDSIPLGFLIFKPQPDVYSIVKADQDNGIATQLINQDCKFADTQGHVIPHFSCNDAAVTLRFLEGDVHADCAVDVTDQQQIAFRWGSRVGNLLYNSRFDLMPSGKAGGGFQGDGQIDTADLQMVFGRHGSTCLDDLQDPDDGPHPPQPPVDPKGKQDPP